MFSETVATVLFIINLSGSLLSATYNIHQTGENIIIVLIVDWNSLSVNDVTIPVQSVLINVDSSCIVIISSFGDRECQLNSELVKSSNDNTSAITILGGIASAQLLFVLINFWQVLQSL